MAADFFLWGRRPLNQLYACAPRIGDICERGARLVLADRLIELDALRSDLLDKGLQVLHVKADVVENAAFRGSLGGVSLGKPELPARDVESRHHHGRSRSSRTGAY
jgi:hypothetical protein